MHRRSFIRSAAFASAAWSAHIPFVRSAEPGKKFRTALIGCGWWGKNILKEAMASGRCKIVALADVDASGLEITSEQVTDLSGDQPKGYGDYRELVAKEKPEIVIIATPDHWHALNTIEALKGGAHVYVEKPTGHTVNESKAMLRAARESGRVIQVGLHRRIGPHHVSAMKFLKSGAVGDVGMVRAFAHSGGGRESASANEAAPDGMNWDFWCGPAPLRPFNKKLHPGGWRRFLDYANGTLGDWGVHWLDQVLWWNGGEYPHTIFCTGGRPVAGAPIFNEKEQTADAPDHQVATYVFDRFTCVWEHRHFAENNNERHKVGAYFYGTKGILHIGWRDGWTFYPSNKSGKMEHENAQLQEPDGHNIALLWADFIRAIDAQSKPLATIEIAHRASVLPLLGMISWRAGRSLRWDGTSEQIRDDREANAMLQRSYRAPWSYPV